MAPDMKWSHLGRMLRRLRLRLALGVCFLVVGPALAETASAGRTWLVSGAELNTLLQGKGADGFCAGAQCQDMSSARASAYIQGVADASRGQWCGQGHILPHELVERVSSYLRQLPPGRLHQDASSLVAEGLRMSFPCRRALPGDRSSESGQQ